MLAANLRVDVAGAAVRGWLAEEDVECVLLKGRALADRLYDHAWERPYSDTDLLVAPDNLDHAERTLLAHGYRRLDRDGDRLGAPGYAHTFEGADGSLIDLHWNLSGVAAPGAETWRVIGERTVEMMVGGRLARVPDDAAAALLVTLHNAHHGGRWPSTQPDLERALALLDVRDWRAASELADRLGARQAFAAGLHLSSAGAELARRIGVSTEMSLEYRLRAEDRSYGAWALHRVAALGDRRQRVRVLLGVLMPGPETMRRFVPLARRGRLGLFAAYLVRPPRLLVSAVPAWLEYRRHRRASLR